MRIAVVANTLERAIKELHTFYANDPDVFRTSTMNRVAHRDGTVLEAVSINDVESFKTRDYDQYFITSDLDYSHWLIEAYYRMITKSCIPEPFIIQVLEDNY